MAYEQGLPGGEENPASSWLWRFASRRRMLNQPRVSESIVDYCSWGRPFRARTKLMLFNLAPPPSFVDHKCRGRGICSFSKKPHEQLTGVKGKEFATKQKNSYPPGMCQSLARVFAETIGRNLVANRWRLLEPIREPEHCLNTGSRERCSHGVGSGPGS